jgi:hypothetical protein
MKHFKFFPELKVLSSYLSCLNIVLSRLWIPEVGDGRYSQYVMAAQHGIMSAVNDTQTGSCEHHFPSCRSQVRKIFDMDALNFWKFLSSTFNFRISEW